MRSGIFFVLIICVPCRDARAKRIQVLSLLSLYVKPVIEIYYSSTHRHVVHLHVSTQRSITLLLCSSCVHPVSFCCGFLSSNSTFYHSTSSLSSHAHYCGLNTRRFVWRAMAMFAWCARPGRVHVAENSSLRTAQGSDLGG